MSAAFTPDRRAVIAMTAGASVLPMVLSGEARATPKNTAIPSTGSDQPFDTGWRFHLGAGDGFDAAALDDGGWRAVDLPHDWSIEDVPGGVGPFRKDAIGGTATGFTTGGEGWYRKHFRVDGYPKDARIEILFDGVIQESEVWLNGIKLGDHFHGYAPFAFDLTPYLNRDGDNVLAVRARSTGKDSRWYAGAGIYRQVRLDVMPPRARLARWGVAAWTQKIEGGSALIDVTTLIDGPDPSREIADPPQYLVTRLRDANGRVAAEASTRAVAKTKQTLTVRGPALWSPDSPYLYTLETELRRGDAVLDRVTQPFGIRIITMDAKRGMTISANPQAVGSFQRHEAQSFHGRALAILRSTGKAGTVRIEARSEGLAGGVTTVKLA